MLVLSDAVPGKIFNNFLQVVKRAAAQEAELLYRKSWRLNIK